jgi:hypothetical protein
MRTSNQRMPHMRTPVLVALMLLLVATLLPAENPENPQVAQLLAEAKE